MLVAFNSLTLRSVGDLVVATGRSLCRIACCRTYVRVHASHSVLKPQRRILLLLLSSATRPLPWIHPRRISNNICRSRGAPFYRFMAHFNLGSSLAFAIGNAIFVGCFFFSNPHRHCSWRGCEKKGKNLKRKRPEIEVTYQDHEVFK